MATDLLLPFNLTTLATPLSASAFSDSAVNTYKTDDAKWAAVLSRDKGADTAFVYCVKSTHIFCRPTCPSRRPKRANVEFAPGPSEAVAMGYRTCKRCLPDGLSSPHDVRQSVAVAQAEILIREALDRGEAPPNLAELAKMVDMSKYHFLRVFKMALGSTPGKFARDLIAERDR